MKKNFVLAIEILLIGLLTFVFCYTDIFYSLDSLYKDKLYQQPRAVDPTIKIIARDEKTIVVMYGDHLPSFTITEDDLDNGDLFQLTATWNHSFFFIPASEAVALPTSL